MNEVFILQGKRTGIGSFLGKLSGYSAVELGSIVVKDLLQEKKLANTADEIILGQVLQGGVGQAPARQVALKAGLSPSITATTVNKVCGSGLKAVMMAQQSLALGDADLVIAGGMESMSNAPYFVKKARSGLKFGDEKFCDLMLHDGLMDPYENQHMGIYGESCAENFNFSREDQDNFAKSSYEKALTAHDKNYFSKEICQVEINSKKKPEIFNYDEELLNYRPDKIATLKAAFKKNGTITAFNASKLSDGAAALLLANDKALKKDQIKAKAQIIASACYAHEAQNFTTAPVGAIKKLLNKSGHKIADIDLFEINEAFSCVSLYAQKELDIDPQKVNVFGGAVALGHPIGASGARVLVTLLNALTIHNKKLGVAALCLGGGEAVAMLIEIVK